MGMFTCGQVESYWDECLALPSKLKDWDAYNDLKTKLQTYLEVFPLLQNLASKVTHSFILFSLPTEWSGVVLAMLLQAPLLQTNFCFLSDNCLQGDPLFYLILTVDRVEWSCVGNVAADFTARYRVLVLSDNCCKSFLSPEFCLPKNCSKEMFLSI